MLYNKLCFASGKKMDRRREGKRKQRGAEKTAILKELSYLDQQAQ